MGFEFLLVYSAMMLVAGPGMMLYGLRIAVRRKVRLTRDRVLSGGAAVVAGTATVIAGFAFTYFFWHLARFFPH